MSELKPGEYVGEDGKLWRVLGVFAEEVGKLYGADAIADAGHPDFPAAVEALTALAPEPFEWEITEHDWPRRWNGGRVEKFDEVRDMWLDTGPEETVAFSAGRRYERERGHADE